MRALVLGGGGFIGSHVVDELLRKGHKVRVLDRAPEPYRTTPQSVDYRLGDFSDSVKVAEALQDVDTVYHLISTTVPSTSNLDPGADIGGNLVPSVHLFEQMVRQGVRRVVFLSSGGTVYGNPAQVPVAVDHPLNPRCSYAVVKVATEHYLGMFRELYGLSPTILRASNAYGPRQGHLGVQGAIATFLSQVFSREPIRIWGDGQIVRDYLYVTDLARLCVLAGESSSEGTFNAGSGVGWTLNAILDIISEVVGLQLDVKHSASRSLDVERIVLDTSVTEAVFGWRPHVEIRDGIERHWAWMQENARS